MKHPIQIGRVCILSLVCLALFGCGEKPNDSKTTLQGKSKEPQGTQPIEHPLKSTAPSFSTNVPPQVRNSVAALLNAYERGDGTSAYVLLSTDREEFRIANAFAAIQIPIMKPQVSVSGADQVKIEYEMPHPGDIIVAILQAGDDLDKLKKSMSSLRSARNTIKKTETWTLVQTGGRVQFDYGQKSILRLADLYGTDVHSYVNDVDARRFNEKPIGGPVPFRVLSLMSLYFITFDIRIESPEMKQVTEEILTKISPALKQQAMEVGTPVYSLKVPSSWQNGLKLTNQEVDGMTMYGGRTASGRVLFMSVKTELDASDVGDLKNMTDRELLWAYSTLKKGDTVGKVVESGDSQVGGVDAKFFVTIETPPDNVKQKRLSYLFVKDKVIFSMEFACNESDFDNNYDEIKKIKETFQFRRRY
jgi:hypothetical protein